MKKKVLTDKENLDGLLVTRSLTKAEAAKAKTELSEARRTVQAELSDQDRLAARILQFKLKLKEYLSKDYFDPGMTFSACLLEYIFIINKKQRAFADEIDMNETELSQVINQHRHPAEYLFVRLEIHSNKNIPAEWWYRLVEKQNEHLMATNVKLRKEQRKHVRKKLRITV